MIKINNNKYWLVQVTVFLKYCNVQVNIKYRGWSCQDSQKLQNNASSHYSTTVFVLCIYFLQYETPLFGIHLFRTRRLIHTPSLPWLHNLNFKLGALRHKKRSGLAFYTRTLCLRETKIYLNSSYSFNKSLYQLNKIIEI